VTIRLQIDFETAANAAATITSLREELESLEVNINATASASAEASVTVETMERSFSKAKVAAIAVVAAVAGVTLALRGVAQASIEGEKDFTRLDGALRGVGAGFDSSDASIQRFFMSLQSTTRFAGGEAAQAMETITRRTRDYALTQEQLVAITRISADVAERRGMTLNQASEQVVRALEGETRQMRELGVTGEDTDEIFASLVERFGGASAEINGLDQATARLSNAKDDLIRVGGRLITQNQALTNTTRNVARIIEVFTAVLQGGTAETDALRRNLVAIFPVARATGASVSFLGEAVAGVVDVVTVAINTFRVFEGVLRIVTAAATTQASVVLILGTSLLDGLMIPIQVVTGALGGLSEAFARLFDLVPGMEGMAARARSVGSSWDGLNDSASRARETLRGMRAELVDGIIPRLTSTAESVMDLGDAMARSTANAAEFRERFRELVADFDFGEDDAVTIPVGLTFNREAAEAAAEEALDVAEALEVDKHAMTIGRVQDTLREEERLRREQERELARLNDERARGLQRAADLEFSLLSRSEQQRRILAQTAAEFEINSFEERAAVFARIEQERVSLGLATNIEEARLISERLDLLRQFAAEADRIDAEATRAREERARRLASVVTSASMAMGTALGNIFSGADPGEEFSAAVRRLIGNMLIAQGTQLTIAGAAQLIPGPLFNPVAGGANLALGAAATVAGAALGATAGAPAVPSAAPALAPPAPPSMGNGGGGSFGDTYIINANESIISNPVNTAEDLRRLTRQGRRSGVREGRSAA
jgi:hypothetical protein